MKHRIRIYYFLILSVFLFSYACRKERMPMETKDKEGVVIEKEFLWKTVKTDKRFASATVNVRSIYNNRFINSSDENGVPRLAAYDVISGEKLWEWGDYLKQPLSLDVFWEHIYQNRLYYQDGNRSYCINLDNGSTVYKEVDEYGYTHPYINGYEGLVFKTVNRIELKDGTYGTDYIVDVNNKLIKTIPISPVLGKVDAANEMVVGTSGGTMFESSGNRYFIRVAGQVDSVWNAYTYLELYNYDKEEWVYTGQQIIPAGVSRVADGFPLVEDDIVVNSIGDYICANDLWTGDSLWAVDCDNNFVFGGFFIDEGHVYAMAEDRALICFELQTGTECWRMDDRGLGTTSQMVHHNGVIYFTSGGNGRLMAVDMATGELLWNIESPETENFNREIAIWEGDADHSPRVLTATYKSVLAYDVIR